MEGEGRPSGGGTGTGVTVAGEAARRAAQGRRAQEGRAGFWIGSGPACGASSRPPAPPRRTRVSSRLDVPEAEPRPQRGPEWRRAHRLSRGPWDPEDDGQGRSNCLQAVLSLRGTQTPWTGRWGQRLALGVSLVQVPNGGT